MKRITALTICCLSFGFLSGLASSLEPVAAPLAQGGCPATCTPMTTNSDVPYGCASVIVTEGGGAQNTPEDGKAKTGCGVTCCNCIKQIDVSWDCSGCPASRCGFSMIASGSTNGGDETMSSQSGSSESGGMQVALSTPCNGSPSTFTATFGGHRVTRTLTCDCP